MNPLLLLAGNVLPAVLDLLVGKRADAVSKAVIGVIAGETGSEDPVKAKEEIDQNPELAAKVRIELAKIVVEEKRLALDAEAQQKRDANEAEAKARRDALDREIAGHKARLDEIAAAQTAALERFPIRLHHTLRRRNSSDIRPDRRDR